MGLVYNSFSVLVSWHFMYLGNSCGKVKSISNMSIIKMVGYLEILKTSLLLTKKSLFYDFFFFFLIKNLELKVLLMIF